MNIEELIRLYTREQAGIIDVFPVSDVTLVCERLIEAYQAGGTIYVCVNGGKLKEMADYSIIIPGTSTFPGQTGGNDNNFHYEDYLSSISHMMTGILQKYVRAKYNFF